MQIHVFFAAITFVCAVLWGHSAQAGCFSSHLEDAMSVNRARQPIYARLAREHGLAMMARSLNISLRLIAGETLVALTRARKLDRASDNLADSYGYSPNCAGFVSMRRIGKMQSFARPQRTERFVEIDGKNLERRLRASAELRSITELKQVIGLLREEKANLVSRSYNCMARHTLESALRFAQIIQSMHDNRFGIIVMPSSQEALLDFARSILDSHFRGFNQLVNLDRRAEPLQRVGIPIICNDIPRIPEFDLN